MDLRLRGLKKGMMQIFDNAGKLIVCTVIELEKHIISQVKTLENDGYDAIQLANQMVIGTKAKKVAKPQLGHFKKASIEPRRSMFEIRLKEKSAYEMGQEIGIDAFENVSHVDVQGVSKGKGYQGVIKRHHFAGGPASHGSGFHRHGGSCGMRSTPGRCLPGQKKAGRMGSETVTIQSLRVVSVDSNHQVILIEGAIPGPRGGYVYVSPAIKKTLKKKNN